MLSLLYEYFVTAVLCEMFDMILTAVLCEMFEMILIVLSVMISITLSAATSCVPIYLISAG